ncbi:MAG: alpha/beta hydrolase [Deltaproteobacteria bacterium]|nr:alpha/beta hydrolase [Deltaproteobacteria bacterium]
MQTRSAANLGFICDQWPPDSTKPSLVFIHGAGGSSAFWTGQVAGLADRANTIAIDLPGRGNSPGPGSQDVAAYARVVETFLDELALPAPVLIGFSMGGAIVLQILLDRPGEFTAAGLVSSGAKQGVLPAILELIENDFETYISQVSLSAASPKTDPELLRPAIEDRANCAPEIVLGDFNACNAFDVRERLAQIKLPILLVSAEEDMLTPPKFAAYLEEKLPDARRVHILEAGHFVAIEQAAQVGQAIRNFLDEQNL